MRFSWLLALYPRAWRKRYGEEFLALLDSAPPSPRDVVDCLLGAVDARLHPQMHDPSGATSSADAPSESPADLPRLRLATGASWEPNIDRVVGEAIRRGDFANLPGAGKPLDLDENPFAGEWGLAYKILKDAGETLPWIALGKEIDADKERLRVLLDRTAEQLRTDRARRSIPLRRRARTATRALPRRGGEARSQARRARLPDPALALRSRPPAPAPGRSPLRRSLPAVGARGVGGASLTIVRPPGRSGSDSGASTRE